MSLSDITKNINAAFDTLSNEVDINDEERMAFFAACERLKTTLETPFDFMNREIFGVPHQFSLYILLVSKAIRLLNRLRGKPESPIRCSPTGRRNGIIQRHGQSRRGQCRNYTACREHGSRRFVYS